MGIGGIFRKGWRKLSGSSGDKFLIGLLKLEMGLLFWRKWFKRSKESFLWSALLKKSKLLLSLDFMELIISAFSLFSREEFPEALLLFFSLKAHSFSKELGVFNSFLLISLDFSLESWLSLIFKLLFWLLFFELSTGESLKLSTAMDESFLTSNICEEESFISLDLFPDFSLFSSFPIFSFICFKKDDFIFGFEKEE